MPDPLIRPHLTILGVLMLQNAKLVFAMSKFRLDPPCPTSKQLRKKSMHYPGLSIPAISYVYVYVLLGVLSGMNDKVGLLL